MDAIIQSMYQNMERKERQKSQDAAWNKFLCQSDINKIFAAQKANRNNRGDSNVSRI